MEVSGYLTGDVKYLDNTKQVEVSERVPHASVGNPRITTTTRRFYLLNTTQTIVIYEVISNLFLLSILSHIESLKY